MTELRNLEAVLTEMEEELAVAQDDLATRTARVEQLRSDVVGARAFLARVQRLNRQPQPSSSSFQPRRPTPESKAPGGNGVIVERILASNRGPMHLREIEKTCIEEGHPLSNEQIRAALSYLKNRGAAERVGWGEWLYVKAVLADPIDTETPVAAGASVGDRSNEEDRSPHPKGVVLNGTAFGGDQDGSSLRPTEHQDHPDGASVVGGSV